MVALYIEIRGPIDSKKLFEELEELGNKVHVTDMDKIILVYGELPFISEISVHPSNQECKICHIKDERSY